MCSGFEFPAIPVASQAPLALDLRCFCSSPVWLGPQDIRDLAVLRLSLFPWLQKACGWLGRIQDWWTPQGEPCLLPWGHRAKGRDKHVFFQPCFRVIPYRELISCRWQCHLLVGPACPRILRSPPRTILVGSGSVHLVMLMHRLSSSTLTPLRARVESRQTHSIS